MTHIDVVWGRDLTVDEAMRRAVAEILLDGFWRQLRNYRITKDQVLAHLLDALELDRGLYALVDGSLAGVLGVADEQGRFMDYTWSDMRRHFPLPVAFLGWFFHRFDGRVPHGAWLVDILAVAPDHRGQGVGTALLQRLIDSAPAAGIHTLKLDVIDTNTGAERLYQRMGFVRTHTRHTGILTRKEGFSAIHDMELRLDEDRHEETS